MNKQQTILVAISLLASLVLAACGGGHSHKQNTAPSATSASFTTQADTQLMGQLMASDAEHQTLTFQLSVQPSQGTVALAANGSFVYTPQADFTGMDEFEFKVSDGEFDSMAAKVMISIEPLAVNLSDYTRQAFAQAPTDEPVPLNSRHVNQDVTDPDAFDDLLMP